jgi:undecaprenyl-diphosphatase
MRPAVLDSIARADLVVMRWLRVRHRTGWTRFFKLFTYTATGKAWLTVSIALSLLDARGIEVFSGQRLFLRAMWAALLAWALGVLLKKTGGRRRPFQVESLPPMVSAPLNDSFPSSHASSSTGFFVAMTLAQHPWAPWIGAWALIVSFSRVYLGVHFPSDMLGGMALGIFCGFAAGPLFSMLTGLS